jgi:hypothetical protein
MQIKIAKFEPYPLDNPLGFAVGYNIITANNKRFYRDILLAIEEIQNKTEEEILQLAWTYIGDEIIQTVQDLEITPQLVGTIWYPPGLEPEVPEEEPIEEPPAEEPPIEEDPPLEGGEV